MATPTGLPATPLEVVPLSNHRRADLDRFIAVPRSPAIRSLYEPYRGIWCPYTDATLRKTLSVENPIFEHTYCQLFVARRDGHDCGRAAAFYNPLSSLTAGQGLGYFGFLEAADAEAVRALLLEGAWPYLRALGARGMIGNMNPGTNDEIGFLVRGYQRHVIMLAFNPPQYPEWLEAAGLRKAKDVHSFTGPLRPEVWTKAATAAEGLAYLDRMADLGARRAKIRLEYADKRRLPEAAREFVTVFNQAWRDHWGYEPMTSVELLYTARELLSLLPRETLVLARSEAGTLVGAALCTPDLNELFRDFDGRMGLREQLRTALTIFGPRWLPGNRRIRTLRVPLLGVAPEYYRNGAAAAIMAKTVANAIRMGYEEVSISWVLEENEPMFKLPLKYGLAVDQTWRLYEWRPDDPGRQAG